MANINPVKLIVNGSLLAISFLAISMVINFLVPILSFLDSATIAILLSVFIVPLLLKIQPKVQSLGLFIGEVGTGVAIVALLAAFVPITGTLLAPFQTNIGNVTDLVAVVLQFGLAASVAGLVKKKLRV